MDKLENLYSLIPLLLILLFSWLFGALGSKAKRQLAGKPTRSGQLPRDDDLGLMTWQKAETESSSSGWAPESPSENVQRTMDNLPRKRSESAPEVTPEPITPRWWGA